MQKIILDTNVLVSALIQRSYPFLIIDNLFTTNKVILCISEPLVGEYYEVLNRNKFSKYPRFIHNAEILLADIEKKLNTFTQSIPYILFQMKQIIGYWSLLLLVKLIF